MWARNFSRRHSPLSSLPERKLHPTGTCALIPWIEDILLLIIMLSFSSFFTWTEYGPLSMAFIKMRHEIVKYFNIIYILCNFKSKCYFSWDEMPGRNRNVGLNGKYSLSLFAELDYSIRLRDSLHLDYTVKKWAVLFPARESFVSDIPAGDGKPLTFFLQCVGLSNIGLVAHKLWNGVDCWGPRFSFLP